MNNLITITIVFSIGFLFVGITLWFMFKMIQQNLFQFQHYLQSNRPSPITSDLLQRKLQAYERLVLFLDRIQYPNIIKRCRPNSKDISSLIQNMKIDVQLEFEHNITQQVYVSNQLWEIINIAKDDVLITLDELSKDLEDYQSDQVFISALMDKISQRNINPVDSATLAIRKEVHQLK